MCSHVYKECFDCSHFSVFSPVLVFWYCVGTDSLSRLKLFKTCTSSRKTEVSSCFSQFLGEELLSTGIFCLMHVVRGYGSLYQVEEIICANNAICSEYLLLLSMAWGRDEEMESKYLMSVTWGPMPVPHGNNKALHKAKMSFPDWANLAVPEDIVPGIF